MSKYSVATLVILWMALLVIPPAVGKPDAASVGIVASWHGGELKRADYNDWRHWRQLNDSPEAIRELIYILSLAEIARARGDEHEIAVQLEMEAARRQLLAPLLDKHIAAQATVSDAEIDKLYHQYPTAFRKPRMLQLRNLFLRLPENAEQELAVRQRMEELHRQLSGGADFIQLVRNESQSQTRFRDGRLGMLDPEQLPGPVAAAVRDLKPGMVSDIVEFGGGLTIFFCERVKAAKKPTPEEIRAKLRKNLQNLRIREHRAQLDEKLLAKAKLRPADSAIVLEIEDYRLSKTDLNALVALRLPGKTVAGLTPEQIQELLRDWALGVLRARYAVTLGLGQDPAVASALRWQPLHILARHEIRRRIGERFQPPDDAALQRHYETHRKRYRQPMQYQLGVIHFGEEKSGATRALVDKAMRVTRRLDAGELRFEEAARRYSVHPSASNGGIIGWRSIQQMTSWDITLLKALRQMTPGQRTGLLRMASGLWLFELRDRREETLMNFEEAVAKVRQDLLKQQARELENDIREQHIAKLAIEIQAE